MYFKKNRYEFGVYIDADTARWNVNAGRAHLEGWEEFNTLDDCLKAWGLTYDPLPETEPQPEES